MAAVEEVVDVMAENGRLKAAIDVAWRRIIEAPRGNVCKHWAVMILGESLEEQGFPATGSFAKAVVTANDEAVLAHESIF